MKNFASATSYNADMLEAIFSSCGWKETTLVCPDGVSVVVTPCAYGEEINRKTVEYFLVHADMPWMGADTLEELADELNKHAENLKKLNDERAELRAYFDKHEASGWDSDSWSWYSDWHKDCYGYRPHGHVCGVYVEPYKGATLRW